MQGHVSNHLPPPYTEQDLTHLTQVLPELSSYLPCLASPVGLGNLESGTGATGLHFPWFIWTLDGDMATLWSVLAAKFSSRLMGGECRSSSLSCFFCYRRGEQVGFMYSPEGCMCLYILAISTQFWYIFSVEAHRQEIPIML